MLQAFNSRVLLVTALLVAALLSGIAVISAFPEKASASIFATDKNLNGDPEIVTSKTVKRA